jgi:hypothetical protein
MAETPTHRRHRWIALTVVRLSDADAKALADGKLPSREAEVVGAVCEVCQQPWVQVRHDPCPGPPARFTARGTPVYV